MTTNHNFAPPHAIQVRVYYEDTDAEGIVYYANYLKFAERGRTEFLRAIGYGHHQALAEHKLVLVVRRAEIEYLAPAKLDDWLDISTEVVDFRNSSLTMKQTIRCKDKVLAEITVLIVAVGASGKAVRLPPHLRQIFEG